MEITAGQKTLYVASSSGSTKPGLRERIQTKLDDVIEYPGSKINHEWYLTKWVEAKIEKIVNRGGRERG